MSTLPPVSSATISAAGGVLKANLLAAADGSLRVVAEDAAESYACDTGLFTPAATPTDVVYIGLGNNTRSLAIKRVTVSGTCTMGGQMVVRLQKAPNGSVTAATGTIAKMDWYDLSPAAFVYQLTANRASNGNGISSTRQVIREAELQLGVAGSSPGAPVVFDFTSTGKKPTLKSLNDWIAVNLNGQTLLSGTQLRVTIEWKEQRLFRVAAIGDSTTALATAGYLNNLYQNGGGIGPSGLLNSLATIDNLGSNGYRLLDFFNGTATFPLGSSQGGAYDAAIFCYGINDIRTGSIGATQAAATNRLIAMIDAAIYAMLNGTTSGAVYQSPKANSFAISSITWASNVATVTTAAPHDYQVGETVALNVTGCTPAGFNGAFSCTITGASTFTYPLASNPGTLTVAGSAAFATVWSNTGVATPDLKIILWGPNGFTADDAGDGPHYYLSAAGNTTLSGLWAGMTLAQAAQAASTILYNAYAAFAGDARIFTLIQKQDLQMLAPDGVTQVYVFPTYRGVANVANTPTVGALASAQTMANQIHPGPGRGQTLETRPMLMLLYTALTAIASYIY